MVDAQVVPRIASNGTKRRCRPQTFNFDARNFGGRRIKNLLDRLARSFRGRGAKTYNSVG